MFIKRTDNLNKKYQRIFFYIFLRLSNIFNKKLQVDAVCIFCLPSFFLCDTYYVSNHESRVNECLRWKWFSKSNVHATREVVTKPDLLSSTSTSPVTHNVFVFFTFTSFLCFRCSELYLQPPILVFIVCVCCSTLHNSLFSTTGHLWFGKNMGFWLIIS